VTDRRRSLMAHTWLVHEMFSGEAFLKMFA